MMHPEVLPPIQQACLRQLGPAAEMLGFYMAGGTAVAIQLGHRQSIDFDWMSVEFPVEAVELADAFQKKGVDLQATSLARRTFHGTSAGVRVSFLEFWPRLIAPLIEWQEFGCRLASLDDLAAMKLLAVAQRGTKKDFIDVYALGRFFSLAEMLDCYRLKFAVDDISRVLAGLCYFDDANAQPMPTMLANAGDVADWACVQATIAGWVRAVAS